MSIRNFSFACALSIASCSFACGWQVEKSPNDSPDQRSSQDDWLIGNGDKLAFLVRGTLDDPTGQPIEIGTVSATLNFSGRKTRLQTVIENRAFRIEVPANLNWYSLSIYVTDKAGEQHAAKIVKGDQMRQVAIEGMTLLAKPATGRIKIRATSQGDPVAEASVFVCLSSGCRLTQQTDSAGVAEFRCLPDLALYHVTAWKGKQLVGGNSFGQRPIRDLSQGESEVENQVEYVVELSSTRPQRFELIDEQSRPVPNVRFNLYLSNVRDTNDDLFVVETDSKGQAIVDWYPDRPITSLWIKLVGNQWIAVNERPELEDGVYRVRLQKPVVRKRVSGRLKSSAMSSVGGFNIQLRSFQGEREVRAAAQSTFSNPDGSFNVEILPGSTYCIYVRDSNWVSQVQNMILFDSRTGIAATPEIELLKGETIRILATQGAQQNPYANLGVNVISRYRFSWLENGKQRHGSLGIAKFVHTDVNGVAEVSVAEGSVQLSVNSPEWRFETEAEILIGQKNTIEIHRPISEPIVFSGKLIPVDDQPDLKNTEVYIAPFDGHTKGKQLATTTDQNGRFEFTTMSSKVAIYAYSENGASAVYRVVELPQKRIELKMMPTVDYAGRLLGDNDQPLSNQRVVADVAAYESVGRLPVSRRLEGNTFETTSDFEGNYTLENVPVGVRLLFQVKAISGEDKSYTIGERFVYPDEQRPLDVSRLGSRRKAETTVKDRFESQLRNCSLYHLRLLVVIASDEESLKFANEIIAVNENERAILGYLPMILDMSKTAHRQQKLELLKQYNWPIPEPGKVQCAVLDSDGKEIALVVVDNQQIDAKPTAIQFIASYEPPSQDAKKEFAEALAEAKRTDRVVWAQHSQTRCGPCFKLSQWVDQHRSILEKNFVFVKIDDARDQGGSEIVKKITGDRRFGIPFVAIFDSEGKLLIDGNSPLGNFGFPNSIDSALHLRRMISKSGKRITESELDQLVNSLLGSR